MVDTLALIALAQQGDKRARDMAVENNMGLVWSVVQKFKNRGVEMEDLAQIGSIGLLKAIDKFNLEYEVQFSTYAVPMIIGEIKRFLRDDGLLKISRSLKELSNKAFVERERIEKEEGREATVSEVAKILSVSTEELVMAMDSSAEVESLQKVIYQGDGMDISLLDKIPQMKDEQERVLNQIALTEIMSLLDNQEQTLLYMRYFEEKTQSTIAKKLGISQVQVSRMERRILQFLREKFT